MRALSFLSPLLLLSAVLSARAAEPATLGLQVRASIPEGDLRDALGGFRYPGVGLSLVAEQDFELPVRVRLALGADRWPRKSGTLLATDARAYAYHLTLEGVYLLRPDEGDAAVVLGPYLVAGLSACAWNLEYGGSAGTFRALHAAGSFGFGWRVTRSLDVELKAFAGPMDAGRTAASLACAATFRF